MKKDWLNRTEYSERLKFEHELIDRRLGWLLTSESILFAAYGIALGRNIIFLKVIAIGGLVTSVAIFVGIVASQIAKELTWKDFKENDGNAKEEFWVRTSITRIAFIPELVLPIVFAAMWSALLISSVGC